MSCTCVGVAPGTYAAQVDRVFPFPTERFPIVGTKLVGIDRCILPEIERLWSLGIETRASCCGHGRGTGSIAVMPEHDEAMLKLGYMPREDAPHSFRWPRVTGE